MGINEALDNLYVCATNAKSETLEEGYYEKCYDRVIEELEQKDKIIDLMADDLADDEKYIEDLADFEYFPEYRTKEEAIKYFEERCK